MTDSYLETDFVLYNEGGQDLSVDVFKWKKTRINTKPVVAWRLRSIWAPHPFCLFVAAFTHSTSHLMCIFSAQVSSAHLLYPFSPRLHSLSSGTSLSLLGHSRYSIWDCIHLRGAAHIVSSEWLWGFENALCVIPASLLSPLSVVTHGEESSWSSHNSKDAYSPSLQ